jgi:glycosyltransferase involved in cell wall biosynthesis
MSTLMISLDRKILEMNSKVADRMKRYGERESLVIVIPESSGRSHQISDRVYAVGTGGHKIYQFFRLVSLGKTLAREHEVSSVSCQDPFMTGLAGLLIARKLKLRLEVQTHGDFYSSDYYRRSSLKNWVYYQLGRYVLRRADSIRAVSERAKRGVVSIGVSPDNVHIHPVHIDIEHLQSQQPKFNLHELYPQAEKIFISIARFERVKNISWLVKVFARHVETHSRDILLLIGDGSERDAIERMVDRYTLRDSVIFLGWQEDTVSYLKSADALLFPSLSEGYGLVVMEAIAVGCSVVMTDAGVAGYEVEASEQVRIVPVGDEEGFLREIESI